jgi:hypothetical protein
MAAGIDEDTALQRARAAAVEGIRGGLARLVELAQLDRTETGWPEQAIVDIARFVTDFYVHHDYHTFTTGMI